MAKKTCGISFSWKRALGITSVKRNFALRTGIPTSKAGVKNKLASLVFKMLFGKKIK